MKINEFNDKFSEIILTPDDNSQVISYDVKPITLIPKKRRILQCGIALLTGVVLMLGFYFLKNDSSFILVIGFLVIVVISELVENWYIIKNIKYFDEKYLPIFFSNKNSRTKQRYIEYTEFKKSLFACDKTIVANMVLVLVLSLLLISNDPKNLLAIVFLLIIRLLDSLLFKNKEDKRVAKITNLEDEAFCNQELTIEHLKIASEEANKYGNEISARKCINTFIVAVVAILMMVFNHTISANFVLFHFGVYYVISNCFGSFISYFSSNKKYKKLKARFIDYCDL